MKKIKLLSLVLALLMLTGIATLFSACAGKAGEITPDKKTVDVDLTGYALLYGESQSGANFTGTVRAQMDRFAAKLNAATGLNFRLQQASRVEVQEDAKEILLGVTDRKESAKALKGIKKDGFVIEILENKIVIVGTNNLYTQMGMDYFVQNYLNGKEKNKTLTLNKTVKANKMESIVLSSSAYKTEDTANAYAYVYKDGLGMVPNAYLTKSYDVTKSTFSEYPMLAAEALTEDMASIVKLSQQHFPIATDAGTNTKEVLIGQTNREESKAALAEINETQYIIAVNGDRVVINAWSNMILNQATEAYKDIIKEATVVEEGGTTVVKLPRQFHLIAEGEHNWVTDFPKPEGEGIALYNTMDNNDDSLQYLYRGTGVTAAAYEAYCEKLKSAGYKEFQSNSAEGSVFKFFTNKALGTALYVAFNAYAHKDEFADYDWTVVKTVDNKVIKPYGFESSIRIISSTIDNAFLPDASLLNKKPYDFVTDTKLTALPIYSKAVGHCYIITLEDGRFIVYDGGGENEGSREYDTIWNVLCELNEQATGLDTSAENPVRIAAWVLSHAHWDHYTAFKKMLQIYGKRGEVRMEYMIANIPSQEAYSSEDFSEVGTVMTPDIIKTMQSSITGGFKLIKPHTGMTFQLGNVHFETLTTWEDLNPVMTPNTNDTNTVFRLTISSQNSNEDTTLIWFGDANRLQSRFMCATYGTYLKSDMSTVAHHGNAGCEIDIYEMVDPETLWWTHNANSVQGYLNPANIEKGWQWEVDQYFAYQLASVKRIFTSGEFLIYDAKVSTETDAYKTATGTIPPKNGYIQLTFVAGTPDFANIKQLKFEHEKNDKGEWTVKSVTEAPLAHTDISGGKDAFVVNNGAVTFTSNYMNKCSAGCPTGDHVH